MKKTYMTPVAEAIRMEQALLSQTSSVSFYSTETLGDGDSDKLLGRGNDLDFDDEEEY